MRQSTVTTNLEGGSVEFDDVAIEFDDESAKPIKSSQTDETPWKILVVDDDPDVLIATRLVLRHAEILGRPLELVEALSSRTAQDALLEHPDVGTILLDVVMEEHDSGLKFARWVRKAGFENVRIVLRTGQPGYTPELDIVRDYDINDYRSKIELSQSKLLIALTIALRSFEQIERIESRLKRLEMIVSGKSDASSTG